MFEAIETFYICDKLKLKVKKREREKEMMEKTFLVKIYTYKINSSVLMHKLQ